MFKSFEGTKFRPTGTVTIKYTIYGEKVMKEDFMPTSSYMKYLDEKQSYESKMNFEKLKEKLEYEYKTYGEVDPIEYDLFMSLLKKRQKILS